MEGCEEEGRYAIEAGTRQPPRASKSYLLINTPISADRIAKPTQFRSVKTNPRKRVRMEGILKEEIAKEGDDVIGRSDFEEDEDKDGKRTAKLKASKPYETVEVEINSQGGLSKEREAGLRKLDDMVARLEADNEDQEDIADDEIPGVLDCGYYTLVPDENGEILVPMGGNKSLSDDFDDGAGAWKKVSEASTCYGQKPENKGEIIYQYRPHKFRNAARVQHQEKENKTDEGIREPATGVGERKSESESVTSGDGHGDENEDGDEDHVAAGGQKMCNKEDED
ncbi:hypothetical protein DPSP01_008082 [Paraphaeosphaeria sporulosa]